MGVRRLGGWRWCRVRVRVRVRRLHVWCRLSRLSLVVGRAIRWRLQWSGNALLLKVTRWVWLQWQLLLVLLVVVVVCRKAVSRRGRGVGRVTTHSSSTRLLLLLLLLLLGKVVRVTSVPSSSSSPSTVVGKFGQGLVAKRIVAPSPGQRVGEGEESRAGGVDGRGVAGGGDQRLGSGWRPEVGRPQLWAWQWRVPGVLRMVLA